MPVDAAQLKKLKAELKKEDTLAIIVLNVGDGDAIIINFPRRHGKRTCAVVDCYDAKKTIEALTSFDPEEIEFICATHPHYDHTKGLAELIEWCVDNKKPIKQFWDSGFRHVSKTHYDLIKLLRENRISTVYPTSGYEYTVNMVRVLVLSPSMRLKNRYDTHGTNINNASIVLKLEYPPKDIAPYYLNREAAAKKAKEAEDRLSQSTIILGADAQFDAWAQITDDFPSLVRTSNWDQMIDPEKIKHAPLKCQVLKVPHHMSKHGITLEVLEKMSPNYTITSCSKASKHGFPHEITWLAAKDVSRKSVSVEDILFTGHKDENLCSGTVVATFSEDRKKPRIFRLKEEEGSPLKFN